MQLRWRKPIKNQFKIFVRFLFLILIIFLAGCGGSNSPSIQTVSMNTPADKPPLHTYYVSTVGDDTNPGTIEKPFNTWSKAWSVVVAGDLVYIRGGVYFPDPNKYCSVVLKGKSGTAGNYIRFFAYPGETPVLDCSKVTYIHYLFGVDFTGNYCYFKGLEIRGLPQPVNPATGRGYFCQGFSANNCSNNVFENLNIHHNGGPGFNMTGKSNNNLIMNSDFHHNYDPNTYSTYSTGQPSPGGDADGLQIANIPKGYRNTVTGCRFWWNSDDGLDLWENEGTVTIQNCWSFWNGYQPGRFVNSGDGNGFKLGRTVEAKGDSFLRTVKNCVAYANRTHGFDQNRGNTMMLFYNNISYLNGGLGFQFAHYPISHTFKNNISYANNKGVLPANRLSAASDQTNNSWNGFSVTNADFLSTASTGIDGPRLSDGSLLKTSFLRLATTSGLIGKGLDVGLPFLGNAPDLGAFEAK